MHDYDVFITYSHRNAEVAAALDTALRFNGLRVFRDVRDIRLGDSLVEKVYDALASARAQLVIISQASLASGWVQDELAAGKTRAIHREMRVIPVVIDDAAVPPALAHLKYLDLREWLSDRSFRRGITEILHALGLGIFTPDDPELTWASEHASELLQLHSEFLDAAASLDGARTERRGGNPEYPGMTAKLLLNDSWLAASLLNDSALPWPQHLIATAKKRGCSSGCAS